MAAPDPTPTNALIDAAVARIRTALPALVQAQKLSQLTDVLDYDPPHQLLASRSPIAWCDVPQSRRNTSDERGATLQKYAQDRSLLVGICVAAPSEQEACRRLRAYADLLALALEGDQTLSGAGLWVRWQATDASPTLSGGMGANRLLKLAVLTFDIPRRVAIRRVTP